MKPRPTGPAYRSAPTAGPRRRDGSPKPQVNSPTIRGYHRDLQRRATQHDSPLAADAVQAMSALRAQAERRYHTVTAHNNAAWTVRRQPAKPATVRSELDDDWWLRAETTTGAA